MKVRRKDRLGAEDYTEQLVEIFLKTVTISNSVCLVFIFIFLFRNVRQSLTLWEAESNNLAATLKVSHLSHGQHIEQNIESVKLNTESQQ